MLQSVGRARKRVLVLVGSISAMVVLALAVVAPPVAVGQATRTWVSGVGDDANPCSRTAPCKTFAGAISKTAAGGEINCVDPGGFGGVTITKSITIDCSDVEAGVLVSGTNAIVVNAGASDVITLRGLDIEGLGTGLDGIRFLAGAALHVSDCVIRGFRSTTAGAGHGILFAPNGAAEMYVTDTWITDNGAAAAVGAGITIKPSAGGSAKVTLANVRVENNNTGVFADGSSGPIKLDVVDTQSTGNTLHGFSGSGVSNVVAIMIDSSEASHNGNTGMLCNGANCTLRVGRSVITDNAVGTQTFNGGAVQSYQTNQINGNTSDGSRTTIAQS